MSLFRCTLSHTSIMFNCLELSEDELQEITTLVEENGGHVGENAVPLVFMPKQKYKEGVHPLSFRVYDINFIKNCVRRGRIVDFGRYRLSKKKLGERTMISLFLNGVDCKKCHLERLRGSPIIPDSAPTSESEEESPINIGPRSLSASCVESRPAESIRINRTQSSAEVGNTRLSSQVFSSQNSYHTAMEEILIKHEPIDSQEWEEIPPTLKKEVVSASEDDTVIRNSLDRTLHSQEDDPLSSKNLKTSPDENSSSPERMIITPSIKVLNLSQIIRKQMHSRRSGQSVKRQSTDSRPDETTTINNSNESPKENENPTQTHENSPEQESGPWIAPCDEWMQNCSENNRAHPIEDYMEFNDGKAPLLRRNGTLELKKIANGTKSQNSSYRHSDESTTCDDEEINARATRKKGEQKTKKTKGISIIANERIPAKSNDIEELTISDSDEDEGNTSTKKTNETAEKIREKTLLDNAQPGPSGLPRRRPNVFISDSDSNDNNDVPIVIRRTNSSPRNNTKIIEGQREQSSNCAKRSGSNRETNANAKRRKDDDEPARRKKHTKHPAFDSDSDEQEQTRDKSDKNAAHSDLDEVDENKDDTESSDDDKDIKPQWSRQADRRERAKQYLKDWKDKQGLSRSDRSGQTRMKFTKNEQQTMVDFLCTHRNIERIQPKGLLIWKKMINGGLLTYRTAQSLQNHFTKILLPHIQNFFDGMSEDHKRQFREMQTTTGRKYL